jgi:hypothetical protein
MRALIGIVLCGALLGAALVALGRASVPRAERISVRRWTAADLAYNVGAGVRDVRLRCRRQEQLWEALLDELQPWRGR